jgi:hypothetical protein
MIDSIESMVSQMIEVGPCTGNGPQLYQLIEVGMRGY